MTYWHRHVTVGRWRLDVELYNASYRPARHRRGRYWRYFRGGQATPGPWWALHIMSRVALTLGHDRTLFGWDDPASDPASKP
jgi:hypothetical protein